MKAHSKLFRIVFLLMFITVFVQKGHSQSSVGIGTTNPNGNAVLELVSSGNNQGFLVPRLTTAQRTDTNFTSNLAAADNGLMVFDSDEGRLYFWFNDAWVASNAAFTNGAGIDISGNTITNTGDINPDDDILDTSVAEGDVTGTYFNLTVGAIQGNPVATGVPTTNQLLKWDGSTWIFADDIDTDDQNAAAVPVTPAGSLTSTNVQSALEELQVDVDGLSAADASTVGFDNTTSGLIATDVQTAIDEIDATLDGADQDASDDVTLTATPTGGDISGDFSTGLVVATVGGETAANIAGATTIVNSAPNLDTDAGDDLALNTVPDVAGDISGDFATGLIVSTVGGETAANIAGATATVSGAPNLDVNSLDDVTTTASPNATGDVTGNYATGLLVATVGGETAANIAGATTIVNSAPNLDTDAGDDLALNTVPNVAGDISGDFATGLMVATVGGETAANVAGATATVNGAPNLDINSLDDVTTTASPNATGDVTGNYAAGLVVATVGGETAANVAGATATVNGAPNLDINSLDDVTTTASPNAAGDITGNYTGGLVVATVGGETAANVAGATATVNGAPNLDVNSLDDVTTTASPNATGDITGNYTAGLAVATVGGETAANIAGATSIVNSAPNLDTDAGDDLALNTVPNVAGDINGDFATGLNIAADAVDGAKIADGSIGNADLAVNSIASNNIVNGQILDEDISGTAAIAATKLETTVMTEAENVSLLTNDAGYLTSVSSADITDGEITNLDISGAAAIDGTKVFPNFGSQNIQTVGTVNAGSFIGDGALLTNVPAVIGAGTVTAAELATGAVDSDRILDGTIDVIDIASAGNNLVLTTDGLGTVVWAPQTTFSQDALGVAYDDASSALGFTTVQGAIQQLDFILDAADLNPLDDVTSTTSPTGGVITGNFGSGLFLNPASVTTAELATAAVDSDKILDGTIGVADIASIGNDLVLTTDGIGNVVWAPQTTFSQDALGVTYDDASSALGFTTVQGAIQQLDFILDAADLNPLDDVTLGASPTGGDISGNFSTGLTINANTIASPQIVNTAVTDAKLDKVNIPLSGFGPAAVNVDLGGNALNNVLDPVSNQDAATKNYVDAAIAGTTALTNGNILVGDIGNNAQAVPVTGDATLSNAGLLTISPNAVDGGKILDGSVSLADLATNSVNSTKIEDAGIDLTKLNTLGLLDHVLITDGAGLAQWIPQTSFPVTIGPGAVSTPELADNAVTGIKIADGEITDIDINPAAGITASKLEPIVMTESENVSLLFNDAGYITTVSTAELVDNAVTGIKIADGEITDIDINPAAGITASKLEPIVMTESENVSLLFNDAGYITNVNTAELVDNAVTSIKIADGTVDPIDMASLGNDLVLTTDGVGIVTWVPQNALAATVNTDGTLVGDGDGTPLSVVSSTTNVANSIVSRDGTGSFLAADITVDNLLLSGPGSVDGRDVSIDGTNQDALQTASGILAGGTDIGDLSGSLVTPGITIRQALEELEAAIEGSPNPAAGLTNGLVPYSDGTGVLLDAPLFYDGVDNFGIGTLAPATKFHLFEGTNVPIIQTVAVGGADINQQAGFAIMSQAGNNETYSQPGTKGWLMTARGNAFADASQQNDLIFSYSEGSGDLNLLKLDHAGFVGINTNEPVSDLQIQDVVHLQENGGSLVLGQNIHYASAIPTYTTSDAGMTLEMFPGGNLEVVSYTPGTQGTSAAGNGDLIMAVDPTGAMFIGSDLTMGEGGLRTIAVESNASGGDGDELSLQAGSGDIGMNGGNLNLVPGAGDAPGVDGVIVADGDMIFSDGSDRVITIFEEASGVVRGDNLLIAAGNANVGGGQDGGNLDLAPGNGDGAGDDGLVRVQGDMAIVHDGASARVLNFEGGASGENVVGIRGPNSTGPGYILTLPDFGPAVGEVLTALDASGNLHWTAPAGFALPFADAIGDSGPLFELSNLTADAPVARFENSSAFNNEAALRVANALGNNETGGTIILETFDLGSPADAVKLEAKRNPSGALSSAFAISTVQAGAMTEALRIDLNGNLEMLSNASVTGSLNVDVGATVNGDLTMPGGNLGVNTAAPRGNLDINGSVYVKVRTVDNSGSVNPDDFHIYCDGSIPGSFTIGLPASDVSQVGRKLEFSSQNLGGNATYFLEPGPSTFLYDGQSVTAPTVSPTGPGNFSYIELILIRENTWMITTRRAAE